MAQASHSREKAVLLRRCLQNPEGGDDSTITTCRGQSAVLEFWEACSPGLSHHTQIYTGTRARVITKQTKSERQAGAPSVIPTLLLAVDSGPGCLTFP